AVPAFDLQALRKMTQADGPILQSMLQELANNLEHEHHLLGHAMAEHDLAQLRASLHRLKGICCLVDALPLAKACIALESSAREYREDELAQRWQNVCVAIRVLQEQIRPYLNRQE
ncbi:MAG: Hpt domain-containing protein, partial [Stenotrophomonas maltophilia]|nr:Hpt domain-containing protein [Stenotrophomonas maltophilia]